MKNTEAIQVLQKSGKRIFTLADVKKLLQIEKDNSAYKKVESLIRNKILSRTIKGIYIINMIPASDFELANILCRPSYISLLSALNYYGMLVQAPYEITSVTPRLSKKINIKDKIFRYYHLNTDYFFDYKKENNFLIASPEKALVDTLFFVSLGRISIEFDELQLSGIINQNRFKELCKKIRHPVFKSIIKKFSV
ncbi:MAG: hypothetical protein ABIK19_04195 [candidate division WOR-3 bacterium]